MDYVIRKGLDSEKLLREWRWLVPDAKYVVLITPLADLVVLMDGKYWFLDAGSARLEQLASTTDDLEAALLTRSDELLATSLVERFLKGGFQIAPGKCIAFYPPIVLGGQYKLENARAIDAIECVGFLGDLNRQLKDLPDRAQVRLKAVD
jgi:hypothetical protein